jgi:hypothetical protein
MRFLPVLLASILLLPALGFFPSSSPAHAVQTVSEPLITTSSPYALTINGPPTPPGNQGGIDNLARVTYHFSPDGTVYYTDLSGSNFTIQPPTLRLGGVINATLPLTGLSYNSSTVEYSLFNFVFAAQTISLNIIYQKIPGSLSLNVTYSGTLSIPALMLLRFTGSGPARTLPMAVFHGSEGFDWSDTQAFTPSFDKNTETVTWNVPKSFNMDPLIVESTSSVLCNGASNPCSMILTTTNSNDVILVFAYEDTGGNGISTITDTAGLLYAKRSSVWVVEEWYAKSIPVLSSDNITVTLNAAPNSNWSIMALAISGTRFDSPFDQANPNPPTATGSTCSGWPTISTRASNTMIIAFVGTNSGGITFTADPGFTLIYISSQTKNAEYQVFSRPQSNLQLSFNQTPCNGGASWGEILDAVCVGQGCNPGALTPNPAGFTSVNVGGLLLPSQLADSNVLSFMAMITGMILLSSVNFQPLRKRKRKEDSFL